jgi:hypothetical protein
MSEEDLWNTSKLECEGTTRWMAPELFRFDSLATNKPTKEGDVWAWAATALVSRPLRNSRIANVHGHRKQCQAGRSFMNDMS